MATVKKRDKTGVWQLIVDLTMGLISPGDQYYILYLYILKKEGLLEMGKGPVIAYAPAVQQKLRDLITQTAEENNIPYQRNALSRATGTDTDAFAYSNGGVASALISLPLRYMHTTVEMLHKDDIENTVKLMYESLLALTPKTNLSYFS